MRISECQSHYPDETRSIHEYIRKMAHWGELLRECLRQQKTEGVEEEEEIMED